MKGSHQLAVGLGGGGVVPITVSATLWLNIPEIPAVTVVFPAATPVASPPDEIVAIAGLRLTQLTWEVISALVPSDNNPIAVNCWVLPAGKLAGDAGDTVMERSVGVGPTTVKVIVLLVTPCMAAVMLVVPDDTPVAMPK